MTLPTGIAARAPDVGTLSAAFVAHMQADAIGPGWIDSAYFERMVLTVAVAARVAGRCFVFYSWPRLQAVHDFGSLALAFRRN